MKKVLVMAALAALVSTSAFALSVVGSKHDLSATGASTSFKTDATEVCVFCHTPHGATPSTGTKYYPLWNRVDGTALTGNYTSSSMDHTTAVNGVGTDAYLCLSCHDGAQSVSALNNPPNSGLTSGGGAVTGNLIIDSPLNNDHPIGFIYGGSATDTELVDLATTGLPFFGAADNEMWCSTCHNVHDGANPAFLNVNNTNSDLCTTCHVK